MKNKNWCVKKHTSISGWSVGTFIEVAVLQDVDSAGVRSGVPMKKASVPSTRQAKARTLANIIVISGGGLEREKKTRMRDGERCTCAANHNVSVADVSSVAKASADLRQKFGKF